MKQPLPISSSRVDAIAHVHDAPDIAPAWRQTQRLAPAWGKLGLFIASLFLFILAITLMKEGARSLGPLVRESVAISDPVNSLGFGWLFAYLVMSGSPVAAAALAFFDTGIVGQMGAFAMITGSRLGASFIVLFIGFLYVLRGRSRARSLSMGLLSLTVTGSTYLLALLIGVVVLSNGWLGSVQMGSGVLLTSVIDTIFDPITAWLLALMPRWLLFPLGFGIILGSFQLFDKCLPQMRLNEHQAGRMERIVTLPWMMFALGGLITLVSMSVSVSLSILVPLSERGFVRREHVIPYIMGANITTFIDTLLAAVLLENPAAFTIVLVEVLSVALVSVLILALVYRPYERAMLWVSDWISQDRRNLSLFMIAIFVTPLILLFV